LGKPGLKRTRGNDETKAVFEAPESFARGMSVVIVHEPLQDDFQGVGFAFGALRREHDIAGVAVPELNGLVLFVALPSLGDVGTVAEEAPLGIGADDLSWPRWAVDARRCGSGMRCVSEGCHDEVGLFSSWHGGGVLARSEHTDIAGGVFGGAHE
jgi:hypothetical protein